MPDPDAGRRGRWGLSPRLALAVAVFAVSWAAILIRLAAAPAMAIAFWRLALATLLLALPAWWCARRQRRRLPWRPILAPGLLLAVHFALWIGSLEWTSVASSVLLVSTQPMFALLLNRPLLGERPSRRSLGAVVLSLLGAVILAAGDAGLGRNALIGDLMALAAAAAAAIYLLLGRRARGTGPLPIYLLKVNGVAALALLGGCLLLRTPLTGFAPQTWCIFAALAAGPHLAGHGLLNFAVRFLPAPAVNLSLAGEPLLSTGYAAALFGELPHMHFYFGAILILSALVLEFTGRGQR